MTVASVSGLAHALGGCGHFPREEKSYKEAETRLESVTYEKGYVRSRYGQAHYHSAFPERGATSEPPLVLLHQTPKSAFEYRHLLKALGKDRFVVAFDSPGYGGSDGPGKPVSMTEFAAAIVEPIELYLAEQKLSAPIDIFGFHTGAAIASAIAVQHPRFVKRVILSGIPYHDDEGAAERLAMTNFDVEIDEDGEFIKERWRLIVQNRAEGVSVIEAAKSFAEDIRPLQNSKNAYFSVYTFNTQNALSNITQPILIVQPHELLLAETITAHKEAIPHADLVEFPHVKDDVFDTGWREYAEAIEEWLSAS